MGSSGNERYDGVIVGVGNAALSSVLDGTRTEGIVPSKSNWALPIDTPPFTGFVVTCGIIFGGLRIDEIGAGLMAGSVFGHSAGAGRYVRTE